ncbi:MAG: metalloregulator ArsR/SmtB family transcription factor [Bacteroidota bacterium]
MKPESSIFKALSDETRLRILHLFLVNKDPLCVCEIVDALKVPQYQASKHLLILKNAGLVDVKKRGTWAYHSLRTNESKNSLLFSFLKSFLGSDSFEEDKRNLESRLLLREEGKCVVGFVPISTLTRLIKTKRRQTV